MNPEHQKQTTVIHCLTSPRLAALMFLRTHAYVHGEMHTMHSCAYKHTQIQWHTNVHVRAPHETQPNSQTYSLTNKHQNSHVHPTPGGRHANYLLWFVCIQFMKSRKNQKTRLSGAKYIWIRLFCPSFTDYASSRRTNFDSKLIQKRLEINFGTWPRMVRKWSRTGGSLFSTKIILFQQ